MKSSNPGTRISIRTQEPNHQEYIERMSGWNFLAGEMVGSVSIVEKSLDEIFDVRHRTGAGFPNRAGVLSSEALGLLAALMLRLRGIEVVLMDLELTPACHTHKAGHPANRNSKFGRYRLTRRRLAKEVGAAFIDANSRTIRKSAEKLGPFDLIFVDSASSFTVMRALFGLNKGGVLVDFSKGDRTMQVYEVNSTPHFVLRHQSSTSHGETNARSSRDLAIADLEYPRWLEEFFAHSRENFFLTDPDVLSAIQNSSLVNRPQSVPLAGREG